MNRRSRWLPWAGLLAACALPFVLTGSYMQQIINMILINGIITIGLYVIFGLTGIFSVAQAAFWGIGAYTAALLSTKLGFPWWAGFLIAPVVAAFFGILLGAPTLRLKTHYLTMATIGFAEVVRQVEVNWMGLTDGPNGIRNIPAPDLGFIVLNTPRKYFFLGLAILALVVLLASRLRGSRLGRGMQAIRDDGLAADAMGVKLTYLKILAFAVSAAFAGLAGAMYAHLVGYISPDVFSLEVAVQVLAMLLIGGRSSVAGAVLGAAVVTILPELLRGLQTWWAIIYGLVVLAILAFAPDGFVGLWKKLVKRVRQSRPAEGSVAE
jgi:branched-chain amino acid transport system permease protein